MDYNKLAELLFPQIDKTPEDYEDVEDNDPWETKAAIRAGR